MTKKTIMVTGAAGAMAQMVIQKLKAEHKVVAIYFRDAQHMDTSVEHYRVDMNKRGFEDIFRDHEFDCVLHLGRITSKLYDFNSRFNANVLGTKRLLDLCVKYNVPKVTILSTYFVYGASSTNPALVDEDFPLRAAGMDQQLVDTVELENLAQVYLWKHPALNLTILRPSNIIGPGTRNALSDMLSREHGIALMGFSPLMQFLHVEDMADAVIKTFEKTNPGIYNVAPDDYIAYQDALLACGSEPRQIPSVPSALPKLIGAWAPTFGIKSFTRYLIHYLKYPVIIDGSRFAKTFGWQPQHEMHDAFDFYAAEKSRKTHE